MGTEADSERKIGTTVDEMLRSTDKQRVALACVFRFQQLHGRHPGEADLSALNRIYNGTPTHTGTALTETRANRFRRAICYSASRPIIQTNISAKAPLVTNRLGRITGLDQRLAVINASLSRAKQRAITVEDVAFVFCYMRNNIVNNDGYVPRNSLLSLSGRERGRKGLSANAIGAITSLLCDLRIVRVVAEARKMRPDAQGTCVRYELLVDLGAESENGTAIHVPYN